jgi:hypothetical protein
VRRRVAARAIGLLVVAVALAACLDAPTASTAPTARPTPEPTPVTTTYSLGVTVWYEGLVIHVDDATATLDERGGPVTVRLRVENPGEEEGQLDARVLLQVDTGTKDAPVAPDRDSVVPAIPSHGIVGALMTYELQAVSSVENAALLIGEAPQHVARVPLTSSAGETVALEPVEVQLAGQGAAGDLKVTLRTATLRWDLPDWSQELPAKSQALQVTYDVTYLGSFAGGFAFTGDNVRLRLPNGALVEARHDGHSQSVELVSAQKTKKALISRFEIPAGTTGRLALVVRNGSTSKAIFFDLGG